MQALDAAWQRRAALHGSSDTNTYRVLNRAGDGFPDLSVDRYADVLVANIYSQGAKVDPPHAVLQALAEVAGARAVYVKYRPVQASVLDADARRELAPSAPLLGQAVDSVSVRENGLRFVSRPCPPSRSTFSPRAAARASRRAA